MSARDLNLFDLNLIKTFLAIWELGSLTAAGERLGLTQPAVSHALKKLREQFSDPLFVRSGHIMLPTEAALRLHEPFEQALELVNTTIQGLGGFAPRSSARTFRLAMSDVSEFYFLPQILARLEAEAPQVRLETLQLDVDTVEMSLRSGQIDLALGYIPDMSSDCTATPLFADDYVCLIRRDNPFQGHSLTLEQFAELTFIDVTTHAPGYNMIDRHLADIGARRHVGARIGHISVVPEIVRRTDMAGIYPRSVAQRVNDKGDFRFLSLPFNFPAVNIGLRAHRRFSEDFGIIWLSKTIAEAVSGKSMGD